MQVDDKLGKCQKWDGCSRGELPVVVCETIEVRNCYFFGHSIFLTMSA
jgi:hypothetical protein